ncbi:tRNA glutamyl-Q(34) synthetase GluQRS [Rhizobium halophytocola]|nr:tRNA glutamyl-Q(34) synthetase GluQRS [Rhizobium halophytocola]
MIADIRQKSRFRFAPSPNGALHLGHALSALLNHDMAAAEQGDFLLRIEDIDINRCTPELERAILDDLHWLGLGWDGPVRRQSEHLAHYRAALDRLIAEDLAYPAFLTRGDVKAQVAAAEQVGAAWPRDPDGAPHYPGEDRGLDANVRGRRIAAGDRHAWRLDMQAALARIKQPLAWTESGEAERGEIEADPSAWGDIVLWRADAPSSYHLSVVLDDALQGITHVVRGLDLYHATSVHRLLQVLLGLPAPLYHHHRLVLADDGRKLSKSNGDAGLAALRDTGASPLDIRRLVGL